HPEPSRVISSAPSPAPRRPPAATGSSQTVGGVAHTSRLLRCVRESTNRPSDAHMADHRHVRATPIRDRSVLCEAVDSRAHSGFVPDRLAEKNPSRLGGAYI